MLFRSGLSGARNTGIEKAKGLYITFVDADDTLAQDTLHSLMELLTSHPEYEILEYSYRKIWPDGKHEDYTLPDKVFLKSADYWLFAHAYLHTYACNKVFRTSLFADMKFPEGLLFEDIYTLSELLRKDRTVAMTSCGCYHYYQNPMGITQTASVNEWRMLLNNHLPMLRRLLAEKTSENDYRRELSAYYMHLLNTQLLVARHTGEAPVLPSYDVIFSGCMTHQSKAKFFMLKVFGLKGFCQLFRRYKKFVCA